MLANDLREDRFTVVSLDTGWVRTETGNTTEVLGKSPPLDVLTSVAGQQKVIMALTPQHTGKYLNWDGKAPKEHPASHAFASASANAHKPARITDIYRRQFQRRLRLPLSCTARHAHVPHLCPGLHSSCRSLLKAL